MKFNRLRKYPSSTFSLKKTISYLLKDFNNSLPLEEAYTPPSSWYKNVDFYSKEISEIFQKNWVCIGTDSNLINPGDYKCGIFANQPFIITKSYDNSIKAFYNVCAHHGAMIKDEGNGSCQELECPYHGWTYNLDGFLIKSTSMKGIKNFKPKENGLKPIKLKKYGRFIFLNFENSDKVDDFNDIIKPFEESHKDKNINNLYDDVFFVSKSEYYINCNWKVYADNWLDGAYHVPYLHKGLNTEIDMKKYEIKNSKKLNLQIVPSSSKNERLGNSTAIYSFIYPNTLIARYGPWLDTNIIYPINENKTMIYMEWFVAKEFIENKEYIENCLKESKKVQDEDTYICEMVSKGVQSQGYHKGRYVPSKESGMYCFHKQIYDDLKVFL